MAGRRNEGFTRLFVGLVLNMVLWFVYQHLGKWGGIDREFQFTFIGGCLAGATLVFVLPVFWRGAAWQAPLAFLLMWLPVGVLFMVFQVLLQYK